MLINLTPHPMHIFPPATPDRIERGSVAPSHVVPPSSHTARLGHRVVGTAPPVDGICVEDLVFGADSHRADWLPVAAEDVWYIVSLPVGLAATDRTDLLVVHEPVRDLDGSAIGCRKLGRPVRPAQAATSRPTPSTPATG